MISKLFKHLAEAALKQATGWKMRYIVIFFNPSPIVTVDGFFSVVVLDAQEYEKALSEVSEMLKTKSPETLFTIVNFSQFSKGVGR
jgi:hypothetical protein